MSEKIRRNNFYQYGVKDNIYCDKCNLDLFKDYYHVPEGMETVFDWHGNGLFSFETEYEAIDLCKTLNDLVDTIRDQKEQIEFFKNKASDYEKNNRMVHDLLKVIDGLVMK